MRWMRALCLLALPGLVVVLGGCLSNGPCSRLVCHMKQHWPFGGPYQLPPPEVANFGQHVKNFQTAQAIKADAADFTFFLDEWYLGGPRLGPFGQRHLLALVPVLNQVPTPVMIQCGVDPVVDEKRRQFVVDQFAAKGVQDADQRVVLGFPDAEGLDGEFSERLYITMLYRGSNGLLGRNGFRSSILPGAGLNGFSTLGGLGMGGFGGLGIGGIAGFPGY